MPKGALLHTHGIATGSFTELANVIQGDSRIHIYVGDPQENICPNEFRYLTETTKDWKQAASIPMEELLKILIVQPTVEPEERWKAMQNIWQRCRCFSDCIPIWQGRNSFFWTMLTDLHEAGISYVDIKQLIPWDGFFFPGREEYVDIDYFMNVFIDTVSEFKSCHPSFVGAKIVWASLKIFDCSHILRDLETVSRLCAKYPGHIAGYDLVGEEDKTFPIHKYFKELKEFQQKGLKLHLHAGETLNPCYEQLLDALALNCERIGHAYGLPRYPDLMTVTRSKKVVIECCPISNQVLGYVKDFRNHPGRIMINSGLHLSLSPDDGGMFGSQDPSFDFTVVAKAWDVSLSRLKAIARGSFVCLESDQRQKAEMIFDEKWKTFISENF